MHNLYVARHGYNIPLIPPFTLALLNLYPNGNLFRRVNTYILVVIILWLNKVNQSITSWVISWQSPLFLIISLKTYRLKLSWCRRLNSSSVAAEPATVAPGSYWISTTSPSFNVKGNSNSHSWLRLLPISILPQTFSFTSVTSFSITS